jgi:hypothetical protein
MRRLATIFVIAMAVLVFPGTSLISLSSWAFAAELDRAEYVAAAEPICKKAVKENLGIFRDIKAAAPQKASKRIARAASGFHNRLLELEAVPQPTTDEPRLKKWLTALATETELLAALSRSLKAEKKAQAQRNAERLHKNANYANNLVLGFGFAYCTLDPGRFL